ncbi:MAG: MMPL family transporter [Thermomicrobiales bacterium]
MPREAYDILARDFEVGLIAPVEFVIDTPRSPESEALIEALRADLATDPGFATEDFTTTWNDANDLAHVTVPMTYAGSSQEAIDDLDQMRDDVVPRICPIESDVYVTGEIAFTADFLTLVDDWTPIVFAFVLGLSFILLLVVFRSIVVPLKAILMNLLSVGAAYGLIVLVFQKGYLADLLSGSIPPRQSRPGSRSSLLRPVRPVDGLPRLCQPHS